MNKQQLEKRQDIIFATGSIIFILSMLPLALQEINTVPRITSLATAGVLGLYAVNAATLNLRYFTIMNLIMSFLWMKIYLSNGG